MRSKFFFFIILFFLTGLLYPADVQSQRAGQDAGAESYQDLIKRNFKLRKDLKDLEEKYIGLENERKFLILHVKELQETKDSRSREIQNLKNMIASLRIEMLKDPKLTKTINSLNKRLLEITREKDLLREKAGTLESEKNEFMNELKELRASLDTQGKSYVQERDAAEDEKRQAEARSRQLTKELEEERAKLSGEKGDTQRILEGLEKDKIALEAKNKDMEKELKEAQVSLGNAEDALKEEMDKIQGLGEQHEKKTRELTKELEAARMSLAKTENMFEALKKKKRGVGDLESSIGQLDKEKDELEQILAKLEKGALENEQKNKRLTKELQEARLLLGQKEKALKGQGSQTQKERDRFKKEFEKADAENKKLEDRAAQLREKFQETEKINRQLMTDLKKEQSALKVANKDLKKERLKTSFEREHFEERLKFAKADKAMVEAKIQGFEERAFNAEAQLQEVEEELEKQAAKTLSMESETATLQQEKFRLEEKLVRYIERFMSRQGTAKSASEHKGKGDRHDEEWRPDRKLKSKEEIARKKLDMHYNLALAYDKRGMYKEEEREYLKCLKINPKDANVHYNLAILYDDKMNMNSKAIHHYEKFIQLRPIGEGVDQVKKWLLYAQQERRLGFQSK